MKHSVLLFLFAILWVMFMWVALTLPDISQAMNGPANFVLENALSDTGAFNIIASVITDYRAFDTLGETTILFISIIAVLSILHTPSEEDDHA